MHFVSETSYQTGTLPTSDVISIQVQVAGRRGGEDQRVKCLYTGNYTGWEPLEATEEASLPPTTCTAGQLGRHLLRPPAAENPEGSQS